MIKIEKLIKLMNLFFNKKKKYFFNIKKILIDYYKRLSILNNFDEKIFFSKFFFIKSKILVKNFNLKKISENFLVLSLFRKSLFGWRIPILKKKILEKKGEYICKKRIWKIYRKSFFKKIEKNKFSFFCQKFEKFFLLKAYFNVKFSFKFLQMNVLNSKKNFLIKKHFMKILLKKFIFNMLLKNLELFLRKKKQKIIFKKIKYFTPF